MGDDGPSNLPTGQIRKVPLARPQRTSLTLPLRHMWTTTAVSPFPDSAHAFSPDEATLRRDGPF